MGRRDSQISIPVDRSHANRLSAPVLGVILNNAEGVYPYVSDPDLPRDLYGVSVSSGYGVPGQIFGHLLHTRGGQDEGFLRTPSVAKRSVAGSKSFCLDHFHLTTLIGVVSSG